MKDILGRNQVLNAVGEYLFDRGCPELIVPTLKHINYNLFKDSLIDLEMDNLFRSLFNRSR